MNAMNGMKLSFTAETRLLEKEMAANALSFMHGVTVTFSHEGKKYKFKPDGSMTIRKKKKGKPETKDKLYHRIIGLTKKMKEWGE